MSELERKLRALGQNLPAPKPPVANYLGCKRVGSTLYVSGRVSRTLGEVGTDLTVDEARGAAREALLEILAIVKEDLGDLDLIAGVDKLVGFVRSAPTFIDQPLVIDGASDLLVALFGESGRHARTATGVSQLPFGAAVQLEMVLRLTED
jgi:enamine deaminase RidA (YjgF/YER057c/UK114 family)